jgi:anaerobic selenocysteine-containing dehydrogenase
VSMHPDDAAARGIAEGDAVRVSNERGTFTVMARLSDDVPRGVAVAPMGAWRKHTTGSATVNALTPFAFADLGNAPTFSDNLVEVTPVGS